MRNLFSVYILFLCLRNSFETSSKATFGPFRSTLVRVEQCKQTSYPLDPYPPISMTLELYNTSKRNFLMKGNFTVNKENKQIKLKMKQLSWQNEQWKMISTTNYIRCHGIQYHTMLVALGIKYDRETCGFLKGQYYFENIDPDVLYHLWVTEAEYGRTLRVSETTRGDSTYTCWEFENLIEPL